MSPTHHNSIPHASVSPMGSQTARWDSDQRRTQEAGMSLLGLAFDGSTSHHASPSAHSPSSSYGSSPVQQHQGYAHAVMQFDELSLGGVDPDIFMEGVMEHSKYLGMDPERDQDLLWIARKSLVANIPPGWHQVMTQEGVPYYYNDESGDSRWEHPSDQDYKAMYREATRMKAAGEPIDAVRLTRLFTQHHRYHQPNTSHLAITSHPHGAANHGQYSSDAWAESPQLHPASPPSHHQAVASGFDGDWSEYAEEVREATGEGIAYSPRDDDESDDDGGGDDSVVTKHGHTSAAADSHGPTDATGHVGAASLYAELNECKKKLELQREHQDVVDALQRTVHDIAGQLEAQLRETLTAHEATKAAQNELATATRDKHTNAEKVAELEETLKQVRQQLAKEAQDNLTLRQEVKTLTMRLQDAEKSTAADDVQVIL
ncbi:hypothetical protein DYB25_010481, partial [Aphanomyces astaci]